MARPRLIPYSCGLHMGPMPVPQECPMCARARAALAAEPPVKGYGVGTEAARLKRTRAATGSRAGQYRTGTNEVRFPRKRKSVTAEEFREALFKTGKRKDD